MTAAGVCTTGSCVRAMLGVPIEVYAGPGEFCPECGERLELLNDVRFDRDDFVRSSDPIWYESRAAGSRSQERLDPVEIEQPQLDPEIAERPRIDPANSFDSDADDAFAALFATFPRPNKRVLVIGGFGLVLFATSVFGGASILPGLGMRVCTSSMTDRIGANLTNAYTAQHRSWPYHASVGRAGAAPCDIRFQTATSGRADGVIARDGVVVIVNPRNPVAPLSGAQVRDIFSGKITDWSQVGGARGPIVVLTPPRDSDEVRVLNQKIMSGNRFGSRVNIVDSAVDVVERIVGKRETGAIGIVPLSVAGNAKVLPFAHATAPSLASVAAERYPLFVRVLASSDFRSPTGIVAGILDYARSTAARPTIVRTALAVPR